MPGNNFISRVICVLVAWNALWFYSPAVPGAPAKSHAWRTTDIFVTVDGALGTVYINNRPFFGKETSVSTGIPGIQNEDLFIHTHPGDWIVFQVVCLRQSRPQRGFAAVGRSHGATIFLSESHSPQWCATSDGAHIFKFLQNRTYLRNSATVIPAHPSQKCLKVMNDHSNFTHGQVIWARGTARVIWIKCIIPRHKMPLAGTPTGAKHQVASATHVRLSQPGPIKNGIYTLTNQLNHLALNDPAGSDQPDTTMDQATADGSKQQQWEFTYQGHSLYTIKNVASALYLTGPETRRRLGLLLRQEKANHTKNQEWKLQPDGQGFLCVNAACGLVMDDSGRQVTPGANVDLWSIHHVRISGNQTWILRNTQPKRYQKPPHIALRVALHPAKTIPIHAAKRTITFTDVLAVAAMQNFQGQLKVLRAGKQHAEAKATRDCDAALRNALAAAITENLSGEAKKIGVALTALEKSTYRPSLEIPFTMKAARVAWRKYRLTRAVERAVYLEAKEKLRNNFAKALKPALLEAVDSGNVSDALLIEKTIHRLNHENADPWNIAGNVP